MVPLRRHALTFRERSLMRRLLPALVLLVLAPLVAEVLLGNLPLTDPGTLAALPFLALLYGTGAILVREAARRLGRGYPTILWFSLAYGIVEEGLVVQTLFNGAYLGNDLHSYGELPALGMGLPWTLSVLTLHSIWSIAVPVAIVESLFPGRGPWLKVPGTVLVAVLFVLGAVAFAAGTAYTERFFATPTQLVGAACAALVAVALGVTWGRVTWGRVGRDRVGRSGAQREAGGVGEAGDAAEPTPSAVRGRREAPRPIAVGAATFVVGSAFFALYFGGQHAQLVPAALFVAGVLAVQVLGLGALGRFSRRTGWTPVHVFAAAAGATLVYCWAGIGVGWIQGQDTLAWFVGQSLTAAAAIGLLVVARRTVTR